MKFVNHITWDDVPHLTESAKADLESRIQPYQRQARTKGIPTLGAGAVYPIPEDDVLVSDFPLPPHWPRGYGMDVGWKRTAALWGARNPDTETTYYYGEYARSEAEPAIHVSAIQGRGAWIPGRIDPASRGRSQTDGRALLELYKGLGLRIEMADNAVETGIYQVLNELTTGKIKVFRSCVQWREEFRRYRRNEKGKIVKVGDHLQDCCFDENVPVLTENGPRRIADLVGTTGRILSRNGVWANYSDARMTRKQAPVVRLVFSDGSVVRCTPDHRFWTQRGWVEAWMLCGMLCSWSQSFPTPFKSFWASVTTSVASTFSAMADVFTERCGSMRTAAEFAPGSPFITSTTTERTTTRPTLSRCAAANTPAITSDSSVRSRCLLALSKLRRHGTVRQQESSGIGSTTRMSGTDSIEPERSSAKSARTNSQRRTMGTIASARTTASRRFVANLASTIRNVAVWCVVAGLSSIATRVKRVVLGPVPAAEPLRCVSVEPDGAADVYCLTVPGLAAFTLANGALVHNCRYHRHSGVLWLKPVPVLEIDSVSRGYDIGSDLAWMA